jgi:hypothetical protein
VKEAKRFRESGMRQTVFYLMMMTGRPESEIISWPPEVFEGYADELRDYFEAISGKRS